MSLLREVLEGAPTVPDGGWSVGHLANLGLLLSCENFSARLDLNNLNILFDIAESGDAGEIRDHDGRIIEVTPNSDNIVLKPRDDKDLPFGIVLDTETLKEMGIEQYEQTENDPTSEHDPLSNDDTIGSDAQTEYDALSDNAIAEGVKMAYRRSGKTIKRGFRVTSGFRKGHVVATAAAAYAPRAPASTRAKLRVASHKHKLVRILKGKLTKRRPTSQRLVRMNKRLP